jgi:hypothetical protein
LHANFSFHLLPENGQKDRVSPVASSCESLSTPSEKRLFKKAGSAG